MGNIVSSTIFCARSTNKVENGDISRLPVAIGQTRNVVNTVMTFDSALGKTAHTAVKALELAAKNDSFLKYVGKGVNFVGDHINPLIIFSAGVKVATADDKTSAAIQQASALSAMFTVEHAMGKYLQKGVDDSIKNIKKLEDKKGFEGIIKSVRGFIEKHKLQGKLSKVIYGVLFVVGSCSAYSVGQKFGTNVANQVRGNKAQKNETQSNESQKKLEVKA